MREFYVIMKFVIYKLIEDQYSFFCPKAYTHRSQLFLIGFKILNIGSYHALTGASLHSPLENVF